MLAPLRRLAARGWLREADVDGLLRHAHPLASLNRHYARVEARYWVADDMLALALRTAPGWPPARPGQHIQLLAERDGVRVGRSYSLTRVVGERLEIAVKRHPDGLLSPWLCEHLAVGQRVELQPAQGDLRWPMQAEAVCLLAAGSGLTPLLGLLREALENGYRGPVLWLHYVRHPGQRAWLGELEALAARHEPGVALEPDPRGAGRWLPGGAFPAAPPGRLGSRPGAQPGPGLRAGGFRRGGGRATGARFAGLQTESFSVPRWRSGEAPREVRLRFARSQREVSGDSAASLLEQAEAHGLRPAHGCRQGICASCTCVLLSGCVRDLRSGALCSEPGQPIRLCVSAAHGDLALDL